jgi:predicted acylesterase/phospholipase RssA
VVIEPDMEHISSSDFKLAEELVDHGRTAAEKALPEIKRKLAAL